MPWQISCQLERSQIPDFECRVFRRCHKEAGVGGEGTQVNGGNVASQSSDKSTVPGLS
jgi:hypothetical protein